MAKFITRTFYHTSAEFRNVIMKDGKPIFVGDSTNINVDYQANEDELRKELKKAGVKNTNLVMTAYNVTDELRRMSVDTFIQHSEPVVKEQNENENK